MSMDELKRFITDVKENTEMQEALKATERDAKAIVDFANAKGYAFTLEDLQRAAEEKKGKLSEEELDSVSGGSWLPNFSTAFFNSVLYD